MAWNIDMRLKLIVQNELVLECGHNSNPYRNINFYKYSTENILGREEKKSMTIRKECTSQEFDKDPQQAGACRQSK